MIIVDLYHMLPQPVFDTEKLQKSLFMAFQIESDLMTDSLKAISIQ